MREGIGRHVGSEVVHLPAFVAHEIGDHADDERVLLTRRCTHHDRTLGHTAMLEARADLTDETKCDAARPVFDVDAQFARRPSFADRGERRSEHVEIHEGDVVAGPQRRLEHLERTTFVTFDEPGLESLGPRRRSPTDMRLLGHHHLR